MALVSCKNTKPAAAKAAEPKVEETAAEAVRPELPEARLLTPDGREVALSSLIDKLTYIDIWATWCAPCNAEIPYLEALVDRFKNNDKIQFLSISCDDSDEPWLEKINADKPAWPQYRFADEEFTTALNIYAIPRFMIVTADGRIYKASAERPSNIDIDRILFVAISDK